jgi:hypothetical protein
MITTEELREMAESDHSLHGDLARVCKAMLEERAARAADLLTSDHAELRRLADVWRRLAFPLTDSSYDRGYEAGMLFCVCGLRDLLTPALDELDRLRDKEKRWQAVFFKTAGHITTVSAERDALRAEVDLLKTELHAGDVIANHQSHEAAVVEVTDEMVERALNVWCMRETMSPSVAAIRIRMRAALLAAFGQPVRIACALEDGAIADMEKNEVNK